MLENYSYTWLHVLKVKSCDWEARAGSQWKQSSFLLKMPPGPTVHDIKEPPSCSNYLQ